MSGLLLFDNVKLAALLILKPIVVVRDYGYSNQKVVVTDYFHRASDYHIRNF